MSAPEELIAVARVARPQGLRGEVVADLLTDFPDRFAALSELRAVRPGGAVDVLRLERVRPHKRRVVLKFAGYDTVERPEELRGAQLKVRREELVALPEDFYYGFDLEGCEVMTVAGESLGRVAEVQRHGAAELLAVRGGAREYLIPFALGICREINVAARRIVVDPPEGLLEL